MLLVLAKAFSLVLTIVVNSHTATHMGLPAHEAVFIFFEDEINIFKAS